MQGCGFDAEFAREIRQRLGLSLTQMAELTWRVPRAVSYWESGTTKMPRTVRRRLLSHLVRLELAEAEGGEAGFGRTVSERNLSCA